MSSEHHVPVTKTTPPEAPTPPRLNQVKTHKTLWATTGFHAGLSHRVHLMQACLSASTSSWLDSRLESQLASSIQWWSKNKEGRVCRDSRKEMFKKGDSVSQPPLSGTAVAMQVKLLFEIPPSHVSDGLNAGCSTSNPDPCLEWKMAQLVEPLQPVQEVKMEF